MERLKRRPKEKNFSPPRGAKIRTARIKKNLSQIQLASMLYVTQATISKWESGLSIPPYHLESLGRILGLSRKILRGTEPPTPLGPPGPDTPPARTSRKATKGVSRGGF